MTARPVLGATTVGRREIGRLDDSMQRIVCCDYDLTAAVSRPMYGI
jgi:hypothetical protein